MLKIRRLAMAGMMAFGVAVGAMAQGGQGDSVQFEDWTISDISSSQDIKSKELRVVYYVSSDVLVDSKREVFYNLSSNDSDSISLLSSHSVVEIYRDDIFFMTVEIELDNGIVQLVVETENDRVEGSPSTVMSNPIAVSVISDVEIQKELGAFNEAFGFYVLGLAGMNGQGEPGSDGEESAVPISWTTWIAGCNTECDRTAPPFTGCTTASCVYRDCVTAASTVRCQFQCYCLHDSYGYLGQQICLVDAQLAFGVDNAACAAFLLRSITLP